MENPTIPLPPEPTLKELALKAYTIKKENERKHAEAREVSRKKHAMEVLKYQINSVLKIDVPIEELKNEEHILDGMKFYLSNEQPPKFMVLIQGYDFEKEIHCTDLGVLGQAISELNDTNFSKNTKQKPQNTKTKE